MASILSLANVFTILWTFFIPQSNFWRNTMPNTTRIRALKEKKFRVSCLKGYGRFYSSLLKVSKQKWLLWWCHRSILKAMSQSSKVYTIVWMRTNYCWWNIDLRIILRKTMKISISEPSLSRRSRPSLKPEMMRKKSTRFCVNCKYRGRICLRTFKSCIKTRFMSIS